MSDKNDENNDNNEISIETILVGESSVGKTSIIRYFVERTFEHTMAQTQGFDYIKKKYVIDDEEVTFNIRDTAGQERYRGISSTYYKGANIAILVYDITSFKTFFEIKKYWYKDIIGNCSKDTSIFKLYNI